MIKINIMKVFTNRLCDRGYIHQSFRGGYKNLDIKVLNRNSDIISVVQQITIDPTINPTNQIEAFFKNIMHDILRSGSKRIFFEGGGDIPIPDFFLDYCRQHTIEIGIISYNTFEDWLHRIENNITEYNYNF